MKKIFSYFEPLWTGSDGKISLKSTLAMFFAYNLVENLNYGIRKWDSGRSLEGLTLLLTIEGGLIAALLGISALSNAATQKIDAMVANPPAPAQNITVQKAEHVTSNDNTTNVEKVDTVNAKKVETVNTQTTNIGDITDAETKGQ